MQMRTLALAGALALGVCGGAQAQIEAWAASGYNPTPAELDAVLDESRALHEAIQNS